MLLFFILRPEAATCCNLAAFSLIPAASIVFCRLKLEGGGAEELLVLVWLLLVVAPVFDTGAPPGGKM